VKRPARRSLAVCAVLAAAALLASCRPAPASGASAVATPSSASPAAAKSYGASGVIMAFESGDKVAVIHHQAIPGLMDEMTMAYELKDPSLAQALGLKVGDAVDFTITAQDDDFVITALKKK
jgi:Cu/Ag efflux protein CusF